VGAQCRLWPVSAATSDPDIFRAVKLLMEQFGPDAPHRVAEPAEMRLESGDMIGAVT
jgi:hypothetical protein